MLSESRTNQISSSTVENRPSHSPSLTFVVRTKKLPLQRRFTAGSFNFVSWLRSAINRKLHQRGFCPITCFVTASFLPLHLSLKAKGVNPIQRCNTSPILIFKRKLE